MSLWKRRLLILAGVLFVAGAGFVAYRLLTARDSDIVAAEELAARRDFRAAGEHLDRYLLSRPEDHEVRVLAAQYARRRGDYGAASAHIRKCRDAGYSGTAIEREVRLSAVQLGDVVDAEKLLVEVSSRRDDPDTPLTLEAVAIGILRRLDPESEAGRLLTPEAAPHLNRVVRAAGLWLELRPAGPDQAAGLLWRGRARGLAGDHAMAMADLRAAHELDPGNLDVRLHLANLVAQSSPAEAAAHLTVVLEANPSDRNVRFALAGALRGLGRLDDAARLLDELLAKQPNDVGALLDRGLVAIDASQNAAAEKYLLLAYRIAPRIPDISLALSRCMHAAGREEEARKYREHYEKLEVETKKQSRPPTKP